MRWVILTDDHPPAPGGVATWTEAVAQGLRQAGDQVEVFARSRPDLPPGVHGVRGRSFGRWGGWWLRWGAREALARADAVLATTWPVALGALRMGRAPVHVVFHGSELTRPGRPAPWELLSRARLWAVSEFLAEGLRARGLGAEVLPAPVQPSTPGRPGSRPRRWVFVARATPLKGGDRFVRLVARAGVRGQVIGEGPALDGWKALARECGAEVEFTGHLPRREVLSRLREADLALLLPRTDPRGEGAEGLGLALLEAASVGVAVVGCRTGGVPEAVGPGLVLQNPDDVPSSVRAIEGWYTAERGPAQRDWLARTHGVQRLVERLRGAGAVEARLRPTIPRREAQAPGPPTHQSRRMYWLYRATAPAIRAQSIQTLHTAHAAACRGHQVSVAVQADRPGRSVGEVLAFYGLQPHPNLHLTLLPSGRTAASLAHRAHFARWAARGGVVLARSKRYAAEALRWVGDRIQLILEVHEVDSAQAEERGEDPAALRALEARVLAGARAVVANAPGTLRLLRAHHPSLPPAIALQNATHPSRARSLVSPGQGIGYVGSAIPGKDLLTLAQAAAAVDLPIHLVGPRAADSLQAHAKGRLIVEGPLPHHAVPDRLCRFRVLVLPLGSGLFGEQLTSPLKLWDYLAVGVPIVGADTPALREAAGDAVHYYRPGDAMDLAAALRRAYTEEPLRAALQSRAFLRTWAQRAAELDAFLDPILAGQGDR